MGTIRYLYASVLLLFFCVSGFSQEYYLFIGTYTNGQSKGIYVYDFNAATGEAKPVSVATGVENPSYLALSPGGKYLYSVNQFTGQKPSEVSAFTFDKASGQLHFLNKQLSGGDGPCYVSVDKTAKWVAVGNYSAGTLSMIPVEANGSLGKPAQVIAHSGKSVDTARQKTPHVHAVVFSPDNNFLLTPDLGMDKVMLYRFLASAKDKPLSPAAPSFIATNPGSGPRHLAFHPALPYAYLIQEIEGSISAYKYKKGGLGFIQHISTVADNFKGEKGSADIHVSPDGKFLYASNRGDANNIAIYAINPANGKLTLKGFQSAMGIAPRNFMIDPTGNYLLAANQQTSNIIIFKRDKETGMLQATGKELAVPNPVCLIMEKK